MTVRQENIRNEHTLKKPEKVNETICQQCGKEMEVQGQVAKKCTGCREGLPEGLGLEPGGRQRDQGRGILKEVKVENFPYLI